MATEFSNFAPYQELFENNKETIIENWVSDEDLISVLNRHDIEVPYFADNFAIEVLNYFLNVAKGDSAIGDCPVMSRFLQFLRNRDINSSELFTICTKFRKSMVAFTFKESIHSEELYNDIAYIFDKNFAGVLQLFSQTIKQAEFDFKQADRLLTQYKKAVDYASLVSTTDVNGIITYVNDAFCRVSGYSREELIGKSHNVVRHEDMSTAYFSDLWHTIQSGNVFHDTIKNLTKNGEPYYVDTVIAPLFDLDDKITGYISIRQDVTERIESVESAIVAEELALEAKEEAVQAEKSKDDFLSNMSHEIRTPLNAILGFVHLLEKSDLNSKDKGYLSVISNSGNSLLSLINDILDFAKIRSGKFSLDPYEFDPLYEFESAIELFTSKMNEKKVAYLVYIDPFIPKTFKADAIRIKQILLNFLGNAIKFTPEHGSIRVQILFNKETEMLSIYVKDCGIGIKKENKDKIFMAFSQEEMDTSRKFGGTGLGLSICQSLTVLMKGEIGLESEEGKGSTFFVHLPVKTVRERESWSSDSEVALFYDQSLKGEYALLEKYFKEMKVPYLLTQEDGDIPDAEYLIFSNDYYEKHLLKSSDKSKLERQKIILLDFIHGSHESLASNIEKLFFPIYPTKIFKLFGSAVQDESVVVENKKYQGHILVAEDNKTNQMLITILLDEYGLDYTLAEDGVQAYEAYQKASFDLVLMDNNMPNMSGIEATEKILEYEQKNSKNYTPIIALTANASNEDRERFLASGMDDFLSKPIDVKELERVLDSYLKDTKRSTPQESDLTQAEPKVEIKQEIDIDYEALSEKIGLPLKMIDRLVESFLVETPKVLDQLKEAIESHNQANIELYAHSVKGSAANLSLDEFQIKANEIEKAAKNRLDDYDYKLSFDILNGLFKSIKGIS